MKKIALITLAIATVLNGFAQTGVLEIATVKKIKTDERITSLKIYNNVEVILTDDSMTAIQVVGEKSDVENTSVKMHNGHLVITGIPEQFKERVIVCVPARYLSKVIIHGSSSVRSAGLLEKDLLEVIINGEGRSSIQLTGNLTLNTSGDFPLDAAVK